MKNLLLTIEYDGSNFFGWQRQPDGRTVQGELEKVLSEICGTKIMINGASRTDAGVHAYRQRANFKGEWTIPTERIMFAANNLLSGGQNNAGSVGDVRITHIDEVALDFHARYNAKGKTYIYKIRNCFEKDVFDRNFAYQIVKPINLKAMQKAGRDIEGTHDFKCFQAMGGKDLKSTVRTISNLQIYEDILEEEINPAGFNDRIITIEITGNGFLYNMVRILTGTLVEIGIGKIGQNGIAKAIESMDREKAGHTAPPQGLYLSEIFY
jgi:tRNA pseudouridine38-40 synthase